MNLAKFLRTPFFAKHLGRLLLLVIKSFLKVKTRRTRKRDKE